MVGEITMVSATGVVYAAGGVAVGGGLTNFAMAAEGTSSTPPTGGSYSDVRAGNKGGDVHHMPADSVSGLPREDGPAIWMETPDHAKTASFDNNPGARAYRARQKELISQGQMMEAIQMDIDDIRRQFGNKYNETINQMLEYAKQQGYIQ
jgi:hypothetical protein